jgi:hypothetical protein
MKPSIKREQYSGGVKVIIEMAEGKITILSPRIKKEREQQSTYEKKKKKKKKKKRSRSRSKERRKREK